MGQRSDKCEMDRVRQSIINALGFIVIYSFIYLFMIENNHFGNLGKLSKRRVKYIKVCFSLKCFHFTKQEKKWCLKHVIDLSNLLFAIRSDSIHLSFFGLDSLYCRCHSRFAFTTLSPRSAAFLPRIT